MQIPEPLTRAAFDGGSPEVAEAIARYAAVLDAIGEIGPLDALIARDALARALAAKSASVTPGDVRHVAELDQRLRAQAVAIASSTERPKFATWRNAIQPPASAWWWSLDGIADSAVPVPHPIWAILAGLFITLAVSLTAEISVRFLSGGPDFLGLLSTLSQAVLALLAGSAFTRVGSEWIERFLARRRAAKKSHGAWKTLFAFAVLAAIALLRMSLPSIARLYNDRGVRLQQQGRLTSARQSFARAIKLDPDYAAAHFNLAAALEETLDYDEALGGYQRAIKLDERIYPAYNNLARLYLLRRNDPASALALLDDALELAPRDRRVQYALHKNRGWANFKLEYFLQAEEDLKQAIALRPQGGAAAHCLLAQVYEAQKKDANAQWEACVAFAPGERGEVEASWLGRAQERLLGEMQ